ncbi:hypothetical protein HYC85_011955 [Camellia sinensis]|uniref:Uncharacterized protein n=1 Tax=Camellia sinensis TaxID=4442 RepID=A0A7J7HAJ8_CAMSI|nr:hypothetical protein HYC85_011955 [Camellia sinensis]
MYLPPQVYYKTFKDRDGERGGGFIYLHFIFPSTVPSQEGSDSQNNFTRTRIKSSFL